MSSPVEDEFASVIDAVVDDADYQDSPPAPLRRPDTQAAAAAAVKALRSNSFHGETDPVMDECTRLLRACSFLHRPGVLSSEHRGRIKVLTLKHDRGFVERLKAVDTTEGVSTLRQYLDGIKISPASVSLLHKPTPALDDALSVARLKASPRAGSDDERLSMPPPSPVTVPTTRARRHSVGGGPPAKPTDSCASSVASSVSATPPGHASSPQPRMPAVFTFDTPPPPPAPAGRRATIGGPTSRSIAKRGRTPSFYNEAADLAGGTKQRREVANAITPGGTIMTLAPTPHGVHQEWLAAPTLPQGIASRGRAARGGAGKRGAAARPPLPPAAAAADLNMSLESLDSEGKPTRRSQPRRWSKEEDDALRASVARNGAKNWKLIASQVPGRNHVQCLQRWKKVLKPGLVKGHWTEREDNMLRQLVTREHKNWGSVSNHIPGRTAKQCRERWCNHLDPAIRKGGWTDEEDAILLAAYDRLGQRWAQIRRLLNGRTENAVKIRWKSLSRSKGTNKKPRARATKRVAASPVAAPKAPTGSVPPLPLPATSAPATRRQSVAAARRRGRPTGTTKTAMAARRASLGGAPQLLAAPPPAPLPPPVFPPWALLQQDSMPTFKNRAYSLPAPTPVLPPASAPRPPLPAGLPEALAILPPPPLPPPSMDNATAQDMLAKLARDQVAAVVAAGRRPPGMDDNMLHQHLMEQMVWQRSQAWSPTFGHREAGGHFPAFIPVQHGQSSSPMHHLSVSPHAGDFLDHGLFTKPAEGMLASAVAPPHWDQGAHPHDADFLAMAKGPSGAPGATAAHPSEVNELHTFLADDFSSDFAKDLGFDPETFENDSIFVSGVDGKLL